MKRQFLITLIALWNVASYGQSFEGTIIYKTEVLTPDPIMIPDSTWKEVIKSQFGEKGYMLQKYFYKKGNYTCEIEAGENREFQIYNPKDGLLYAWHDKSDTAVILDSKKNIDKLAEIIDSEDSDTILGIPCKSVIVKSKRTKMKLWYNSDYLKIDSDFYKRNIYSHWEQILTKIGCFPLKIEQREFMTHVILTVIEFEEIPIDNSKFEIPKFKYVTENPMN